MRRLANLLRANETLGPADRVALGLPERTKRPKVLTVPNEPPRLRFARAIHEGNGAVPEHELKFTSLDDKPRPAGAVRVELFVDMIAPDGAIPAYPGARVGGGDGRPFYLRSYTRSPIRLIPPIADVPMRVVYWARWADTAGNVGPFSATAVGWVEGGSHFVRAPALPGSNRPAMIEVKVGEVEPETVLVALMTAGRMPAERTARALGQAMRREVRQIDGPGEEETELAAGEAA